MEEVKGQYKVVTTLPPTSGKQFNSNNLHEFSPYIIIPSEKQTEDVPTDNSVGVVQFPSERLPFVGYAIRDMGLPCITDKETIRVIAGSSLVDAWNREQSEEDSKSRVARPKYSAAELLVCLG